MIYLINLLSAYNKIKNHTRGYAQNFSFYFTKVLQYLNFFNGNWNQYDVTSDIDGCATEEQQYLRIVPL